MFNNMLSNNNSSLFFLDGGRSRAITMENPTGAKGKGGMAEGKLGKGRKGSPALRNIPEGAIVTIAEIEGTGMINHMWFTISDRSEFGYFTLSDTVLRIYWDEEKTPSVEAPLGDFFLNGFSQYTPVNSALICVNPVRGYNCYFSMPFRKKAKITIENQHPGIIHSFFYQIDYTLYDNLPENIAYFHSQYRRERITELKKDYTILDNINGEGQFVGMYMALTALQRYWYGEGEVKFFIDGDEEYPTICGTGLEDYFGGGFGFVEDQRPETPAVECLYQTPYLGHHFLCNTEPKLSWRFAGCCPPMRGFYRFHVLDPIKFQYNLKITVQQIGITNTGLFERQDDISTVAYWYQKEPHTQFPEFPSREYREPR